MDAKDLQLNAAQWLALLQAYGVPESALSGKATSCPMCGGKDRFTYDNKRGRGDWFCRRCDNGNPMAGDGLQLICRASNLSFRDLMKELSGGSLDQARRTAPSNRTRAPDGTRGARRDPQYVANRLEAIWASANPMRPGDLGTRYLQARVPGLEVMLSPALRLGALDYWHEKKRLGKWPALVARFVLPDGRLGTLHRTYLDPGKAAKAQIVSADGEILNAKLNEMTLNPLAGGAVRLMEPENGEIGIAEGLETACAAHLMFDVPMWYALNCVLLRKFVVPEGLGIRVVHIFADFDHVDPKTRKSPGMSAAVELAARLRAAGYTAVIHRPYVRGTDFADEWLAMAGQSNVAPGGVSLAAGNTLVEPVQVLR